MLALTESNYAAVDAVIHDIRSESCQSDQSNSQISLSQSLATMPVPTVTSDQLHSHSISSQVHATMPVPTLDIFVLRNCPLVIPIDNDDAIYEVLPQATTACPVAHKEFVACSFSDDDVGTEVINPGYILKIEHIWQHVADDDSTDRHPPVRDDAVADRDCQEVINIDMPSNHSICRSASEHDDYVNNPDFQPDTDETDTDASSKVVSSAKAIHCFDKTEVSHGNCARLPQSSARHETIADADYQTVAAPRHKTSADADNLPVAEPRHEASADAEQAKPSSAKSKNASRN